MAIRRLHPAQEGQSLVEAVFLAPILMMIIIAIGWFSRVLVTRQQLLMAARYGTDMIAYTNLNGNLIRRELQDYLSHRLNAGRKLDPSKLPDENIMITIEDFTVPDFTVDSTSHYTYGGSCNSRPSSSSSNWLRSAFVSS